MKPPVELKEKPPRPVGGVDIVWFTGAGVGAPVFVLGFKLEFR